MSVVLRKYRAPGGRVVVELASDGVALGRGDFDPSDAKDRKRCAASLHDVALALTVKAIEAELSAIDPAALELVDERGMVWRRPDALPDPLPPVMPYASDLLPRSVGAAVDDIAERMQCPPDFPAAAMLVAMGSILGCRIGIRPKRRDDWLVVPNLWGCVIGRPSLKKSPAIATAEKRLRAIEARDADRMADALREAEVETRIARAQKKQAEKDLEKAAKDGDREAMRRLAEEIERLDEQVHPVSRRIITTDCTIEKLAELLREHPAGLILWIDELIGWMRGLDREDKAGQRQQFLTLWSGIGKLNIDRITRGSMVVESACMSLFGCATPGALSDYVSSAVRGGRGDDGLIQRLQVCVWPDSPREYRHVDRLPDSMAQRALREVFEALADLDALATVERDPDDPGAVPWVRFDADAQRVFDAWDAEMQTRIRSGDLPEAFESHLSKYASLMPSVALILHLATGGSGAVSAAAATMAVQWCEYLESHAQRVYAMATCPERQVALPLLRRLIEWPKDEPIRVNSIRAKNWSGLNDKESIEATLELLMDAGWVQSSPHRSSGGGRPTINFVVHPEAAENLNTLREGTPETPETPSKPGFGGFDGGGLAGVQIISKDAGRIRGVIE
ncbi:MAG: YfjI family protein [Planctomycetota bacterium]